MGMRPGRWVWQRVARRWKAFARSQTISRSPPPIPAECGDSAPTPLAPYFRNPRLPRRAVVATRDLSGPVAHTESGSVHQRNELHDSVARVTGDTDDRPRKSPDEFAGSSPDLSVREGRLVTRGL